MGVMCYGKNRGRRRPGDSGLFNFVGRTTMSSPEKVPESRKVGGQPLIPADNFRRYLKLAQAAEAASFHLHCYLKEMKRLSGIENRAT